MNVKLIASGTSWGKPATQLETLEKKINDWLTEHPTITVEYTHRLSQPSFGWGQLAVAVWYSEHN